MEEIIYLIQKFLTFITVPFLGIVNISITAGWIVLAVCVLRLLLKKAPKWLNCVLWGIVALRLVFPFSIESVFSLIPSAETFEPNLPYLNEFKINSGIEPLDNAVNTQYADFVPMAERTVDVTIILACVWLTGLGIMLLYAFASWARLKRSLKTATKKEGNIYQSEFVRSPFVLGIIRPKIYIPYKTNETDLPLVIAHEKAHIRRLDHLIKPLGFVLLSVYWFNPLLWVAYILLCRDIEAACDEKVIKNLGEETRKEYSTALLNASISRKSIAACPLAFGETGVKERIKGVMNYKKPAFWVVIAAVAVCIVAAVCFLTNPTDSRKIDYSPDISPELDRNITVQIINRNQGYYLDGMVSCEAHKVLATETTSHPDDNGIAITVYLVSSYNEYSVEDGKLVDMGGNMTPLALSFVVDGEDSYALYDYWEPGMGSSYIKDLQAKFPPAVMANFSEFKYSADLRAENIQQAMEYFGLSENDITEQSTTEHTTVMLEEKFDYELTVKRSKSSGVTWMTDEAFYKKNGFHAYLYCLDKAYVTLGSKNIYIGDALNSGEMSVDRLIEKANNDANCGIIRRDMLKDGGTMFYWYDDYTIIKRNTIGSSTQDRNQDLIISYADFSLDDYSSMVKFVDEGVKSNTLSLDINKIHIEAAKDFGLYKLPNADIYEKYGYNVYLYMLSDVSIETFDGKTYDLDYALNNSIVTPKAIVAAANSKAIRTESYDDGGSVLYETKDYAVLKLNTIDGRKDIIIGPSKLLTLNEVSDFFNNNVGVTAPVGYDDEPHFDAVITENNGSSLFVEAYGNNTGIKEGTQAYVSLNSVLSHIKLPEMKKGDKVRFIYDGAIQETYPLQIPTVWAVYELKE